MTDQHRITSNPSDTYEPSVPMRAWAAALRDMYTALLKEGFSESDAMQIIGHVVPATMEQRGQVVTAEALTPTTSKENP